MKEYTTIIAIDPGSNGSITHSKMVDGKLTEQPTCVKMPKEFKDINEYLKMITPGLGRCICFIEKINMRPSDQHGGKMFGMMKLMRNFEFLKAACVENNIGFIEVHPSTWQNTLKLKLPKGSKKETMTIRKGRYKEAAKVYFPAINVVLWNSDALLIMVFGLTKIMNDKQYIIDKLPEIDFDLLF